MERVAKRCDALFAGQSRRQRSRWLYWVCATLPGTCLDSQTWTRTRNPPVNSRVLCLLELSGTTWKAMIVQDSNLRRGHSLAAQPTPVYRSFTIRPGSGNVITLKPKTGIEPVSPSSRRSSTLSYVDNKAYLSLHVERRRRPRAQRQTRAAWQDSNLHR